MQGDNLAHLHTEWICSHKSEVTSTEEILESGKKTQKLNLQLRTVGEALRTLRIEIYKWHILL